MKKNILFFIHSLRSGGKERRLVELLIYLKKRSEYNIYLVLTKNEVHYKQLFDYGIKVIVLERRLVKKDPSMFYRFYKLAKKIRPDIIHTWGIMTTFYAIPTKLMLKVPLLSNLIADAKDTTTNRPLHHFFFKIACRYSDVILGNSKAGFSAYGLEDDPKKYLIYNGVRLERFDIGIGRELVKSKLGVYTKFLILMVASASDRKNYDLFLDEAKKIGKEREDVTFVGVGDGTELGRLQERIQKENLGNVHLIGKREDVEEIIYSADICLLFTNNARHGEGISNSIIEYMAMKKPVITTDRYGGSKEIIDPDKSGYIVEDNVELIGGLIHKLLDNKELAQEMGMRGREIIEQKFNIAIMGEKYRALYRRTIEKNNFEDAVSLNNE